METTKVKMKTIYGIKTRMSDKDSWGEPSYFKTRKERDDVAAYNRILGGIRTYSFEEKLPLDEVNRLLEEQI